MRDEMKREGEMLTDEFNLVLPIPVGARDKARKFLLFLTFFFSLDWKMITVDMFSKNIKPNILMFVKTSHKWMCVLLNNKTLKNIYKVHEHNVNIYQWNSNDQIYAQNDFFFALLHHILFAHACVTEKSPVTLAVVGWLFVTCASQWWRSCDDRNRKLTKWCILLD